MTNPNIKILGYRVLVEVPKSLHGTIEIPETASIRETEGVIIAIGNGRLGLADKYAQFDVKLGDHVVYSSMGGQDIQVDGHDYRLISAEDILAVRTPPEADMIDYQRKQAGSKTP